MGTIVNQAIQCKEGHKNSSYNPFDKKTYIKQYKQNICKNMLTISILRKTKNAQIPFDYVSKKLVSYEPHTAKLVGYVKQAIKVETGQPRKGSGLLHAAQCVSIRPVQGVWPVQIHIDSSPSWSNHIVQIYNQHASLLHMHPKQHYLL